MPLLAKETGIFPDDLLNEVPSDEEREFWVARTKSRQEKAVARWLLKREVGFYLPQYERVWRSSGKKRKVWLPLFPGYIFIRGTHEHRYEALCTGHLAQILTAKDQQALLTDLRRVRTAEISRRPLESLTEWFEAGRPVVVGRGPMKGIEGVVVRGAGKDRLVIRVHFIGQAVAVELDPGDLDPA